jgi:hypothetical protein
MRFQKSLNPVSQKEEWSEEDDQQLKDLVAEYGKNWAKGTLKLIQ